MGISTFTSKEFVIFCRASKIGNEYFMLFHDLDYTSRQIPLGFIEK